MKTALILIDIQNDYFPGGRMALEGAPQAAVNAARLLEFARGAGMPVCHIQHVSVCKGASFFLPGTEGMQINAAVAPAAGEPVILKHYPNSFRETALSAFLRGRDIGRLIVAGMMSNMCVDATVRAAFDMGYECVVAHDACAARTLKLCEREVPAEDVHASFMAALGMVYARLASTDEILSELAG